MIAGQPLDTELEEILSLREAREARSKVLFDLMSKLSIELWLKESINFCRCKDY